MGSYNTRTTRHILVSLTISFKQKITVIKVVAFTFVISEGGFFKAHLIFPKDYPQKPPKMTFMNDIWHPNSEEGISINNKYYYNYNIIVDKTGDVCISILHDPGEDKWGYERPEERWLPIHTVETIIVSVISMLADPNDESPANVDAGVSLSLL